MSYSNPPYSSGRMRAQIVIVLLLANLALHILLLLFDFIKIVGAAELGDAEVWIQIMQGLAALLQLGLFIGTAIAFLMWVHRAYRNLAPLGGSYLEYTPGWAVGWFFVPFANLFVPYKVMREIWLKSDPMVEEPTATWQRSASVSLLGWWWAFWILANAMGRAEYAVAYNLNSPGMVLIAAKVGVVYNAVFIMADVLASLVVLNINRRQEERAKRHRPDLPPPPPTFGSSSTFGL